MKTKELPASIQYEVLNPRGSALPVQLTPLATRVADLNNKVVYAINIRKPYAEEVLAAVAGFLQERFPSAQIVHVMKKESYRDDEPELWEEVAAKADAAIIAFGD